MSVHIREDEKLSYVYLLKWVFLSLLAGILGSVIVHSFSYLLSEITDFLVLYTIPLPAYAVFGAAFTGGIIYRFQPEASGEGIPSYIQGIRFNEGNLSISVTLFKYCAGLATLSTFGNGGVVGPVGRVSAGILSHISSRLRRLGFTQDDVRTASICGMAAAVGSIFQTAIGGGLFAVEISQRKRMGYRDLFPAILSSSTAVFLSKIFGLTAFYSIQVPDQFMDYRMIGMLLILAFVVGVVGGLYTRLYAFIRRVIKRERGKLILKMITGSVIASGIAWFINPELMGTSSRLIQGIISGNTSLLMGRLSPMVPISVILIILLICKALCNCITVGSGMSAGFMGPAVLIGMLLASAFSYLMHIDYASPTFYAYIAIGFSGILASSMNIPLSAAVMTVEIFGLMFSIPASLAAIIGFQVNRHLTLYDFAIAGSGRKGQNSQLSFY